MKTYQWSIVLLVAFGWLATVGAQPVEVVVRKPGVQENPTLRLESFSGPEEIGRLLNQTLRRCGWFRVVESGDADYRVRAVWSGDGERGRLRLGVADADQPILDFATERPRPPRAAVYEATDTLLKRLFEVPGIASARIALVIGEGRSKDIYTINFDGSEPRRITNNNSISTEPSWGGRGTELLYYTYYEPMRMSVMSVDLRQARQRRVARFNGLNSGARVSPDQRSLALCLSQDGAVDLYLMDLQSREKRRLTRDPAVSSSPTWSPDGQNLCYVSDRAGRPHLYLIPARGGQSSRLLRAFEEAVEPDWSRVSSQIAFSTRLGGGYAIAVVDMNPGEQRERRIVAQGGGDWESPSWAPDGRHLVCVRRRGRQRQLVMVDTWLGTVTEITRPGHFELPDWSALP